MKIEELIIDGFKSYATRTVISNWDSQFNAITGLNGSGKSNILDAICFVLGITSMATVRASNLQDLIYKRGQAGVVKASVTIVFNNSEISKSPIGFEKCAMISITRQIVLGGSSKYLINGHKAQQQTVLNLFQSVQLNINNPNFLIMQGKITKVLNMKPSEILSLIEEASGTRTFEERKDKAQKTMAKKEAKLVEIRGLLREEIEPKLEKLRGEKRGFLDYQQTQIDLEKLERVVAANDYVQLSLRFTEQNDTLNQREQTFNELEDEVQKLTFEIQNLNDDLTRIKEQREQELKKDGKVKELQAREQTLNNKLTRLGTLQEISRSNHADEVAKRADLEQRMEQAHAALEEATKIYQTFSQDFNKSTAALETLKLEVSRKEELLSTLSTGVSSTGSVISGYSKQINDLKEQLNESQKTIETSHIKVKHLKGQMESDRSKLENAKAEHESLQRSLADHATDIARAEEELELKLGFSPDSLGILKGKEASLLAQIQPLRHTIQQLEREMGNIGFNYSRPSADFRDSLVKGVIAQLFNLPETSTDKALALQVCAGYRLYNVVVENSEVASQLLERGQLKRRVTIIPLDKIQARCADRRTIEHAKSIAPNRVELALNLIDFETELVRAMEYIFGTTFLCDDPETAKRITFDPQIRLRSITLEGDIYDPEGNLSGGSRKNNSSVLLKMQKYNKVSAELKILVASLEDVRRELHKIQELSDNAQSLQNALKLKKHQSQLLTAKLENNAATILINQNRANEAEVEALKASIAQETQNCHRIQHEIEAVEKDSLEFNSDKGSKLSDLRKEIANLKKDLLSRQAQMVESNDKSQSLQIEIDQQKGDLDILRESHTQCLRVISDLELNLASNERDISVLSDEHAVNRLELDEEKAHLLGLNEELSELTTAIKSKTELASGKKLEIQKLQHEVNKLTGVITSLKRRLDELICEHEWLADTSAVQNAIEQWPNINLDESHQQLQVLEEKFKQLKRKVNVNIMSMIESVEKKEAALKNMVLTIERDKSKIEKTVDKLNGYKRDTLNQTYQKVSTDFGQIFSDLLPGSFAKLVPVNMLDVTEGLEVKVKLGQVWKQSLVELSGGQRSLIALSLIMALLQFKPAPMYILDEVDAALDLSHTQNIGHLIRTRFKGSQFIVVSLKEGMFTNANRIFRTRFQDGTSVVSVM